jgi:hypothetical protein
MKTLLDHMPEDIRKKLDAIRSAIDQRTASGPKRPEEIPTGSTCQSDRVLWMLNHWLLDDEQKQVLILDSGSLFYLYAASYLCDRGLWDKKGSETPSTPYADGRPYRCSAGDPTAMCVLSQWPELGITDANQAQTLAAVWLASVCGPLHEAAPLASTPSDPDASASNLALVAAGIHLARSLDLKSDATLNHLRDLVVADRQSHCAPLSSCFDVREIGAHPYFPGTIQVKIHCRDPELHRALKHHECSIQRLLQRLNARVNPRFLFSDIIYEIEADGYTPVDMKFVVDSSAALQLFTGNRLYADKRTFLRELIQNAIDACHLRKMMNPDYVPEISFAFNEDISRVTIRDNGIGMDRQWLEKYFLKIGISFYQSDEIRRINRDARIDVNFISQFGIGFLSSFLVADKIVIRTRKLGGRGLKITIANLRDYFDVRFLDDNTPTGTEVTLHLKPSRINYCRNLEFVGYLKTNIRFLKVPVRLTDETGRTTLIGMEQLAYERDERRGVDFVAALDFLDSEGYLLLKARKQTDYIQAVEIAHGGIAVFQDGIFVSQLDTLFPEGARQNVIGRINLLGRERCELSMDRNRIFWTEHQLNAIKRRIRHGLVDIVDQFMTAVDRQEMPENTRTSIINHLAIFFDFNTVDDAMYDRIPRPVRDIIDKRFRDFIRVHYAHTHPSDGLPGGDEYGQGWQQQILASFMRKAC